MKVIFSRKGFDSSYGKGYSPILPEGEMLSMPIPASQGEKGVRLDEIKFGNRSYAKAIDGLYPKLKGNELFHFDPELFHGARKKRLEGWLPAFGQAGGAQSHLVSESIEVDDVFLFFGSFVRTYLNDLNELQWEKEHEFHAIFGYLQIGAILDSEAIAKGTKESLYSQHPHFENQNIYGKHNAIYVASDRLTGTDLPGAGTFKFRDELRLTKPGYKKSQWSLPSYFHPNEGTTISRCSNPWRYRENENEILFEAVSLGQDMVVKDQSGRVEKWAKGIIGKSKTIV